jgi:hypothetical protein
MIMKRKLFFSVLLVLLFGVMSFGLASADGHEAQVTVIHGIPGADFGLDPTLPVDVCVNGAALIPDFVFGAQVGPVAIPAATYDIAIQLAEGIDAGDTCAGTTVIDLPGVTVPGGVNLSIIAHRTGDGSPGAGDQLSLGITASIFVNDVDPIVSGKVRVTLRHTALAPGVDVPLYRGWRGGRPLDVPYFMNGGQIGPMDIRPGGYFFSLNLGEVVVFGPGFLEFPDAHKSYIIYAVGTFPDTFEFLVQTIDLEKIPPSRLKP